MEQTKLSYPNYIGGHVLKSDSLNASFDYLDEQDHLTRATLCGSGIISGLEYSFSGNKLTIKAGVGTTADGTLISFEHDVTYSYAVRDVIHGKAPRPMTKEMKKSITSFKLYETEEEITSHGLEMTDMPDAGSYVVALIATFVKEEETLCSGNSCEKDTVSTRLDIRPILIPANYVEKQCKRINSCNAYVHPEKVHGNENHKISSATLKNAILTLSDCLKSENEWLMVFGETDTVKRLQSLNEKLQGTSYMDITHYQATAEATNQAIEFYNRFVGKYPFIPIQTDSLPYIPLGKGSNSDSDESREYRKPFQAAHHPEFSYDCQLLSEAINNVSKVYESFANSDVSVGFLKNDLTQLTGFGIISGLSYTFDGTNLTVKKGKAVTYDGLVVEFNREQTFPKGTIQTADSPKTLFHRLPGKQELINEILGHKLPSHKPIDGRFPSKLPAINSLDNYVVALTIDIKKTANACATTETDCIGKTFEVRPLLLPKDSGIYTKPYFKPSQISKLANKKAIGSLDNALNINVLKKKIAKSFKESRNSIVNALEMICSQFNDFSDWKAVLGNTAKEQIEQLVSLKNSMKTWENGRINTNGLFPIHYLNFLEDLAEATNEFISYFNDFIGRHPLIPRANTSEDSILYLGCGNNSAENEEYRNKYRTLFDDVWDNECKILSRMLTRLSLMKKSFVHLSYFSGSAKCPIKFIWSDVHAKLGDRPMPYYYDGNSDLKLFWDAHHACHDLNTQLYGTIKEDVDSQSLSNTLSLQGIVGEEIGDVSQKLKQFIAQNDLPFTVKEIELEKKRFAPKFGTYFKDYATFVQKLTNAPKKDSNDNLFIPFLNSMLKRVKRSKSILDTNPVKTTTFKMSKLDLKTVSDTIWSSLYRVLTKLENAINNENDDSFEENTYLVAESLGNRRRYTTLKINYQDLPDDSNFNDKKALAKSIRREYKDVFDKLHYLAKKPLYDAVSSFGIANLKSVVEAAKQANEIDIKTAQEFNKDFKDISPEIVAIFCNRTLPSATNPYLDKDIAAFFQLKSYMELCHDASLKGVKIRREIPIMADTTIYLFYFGEGCGDFKKTQNHSHKVLFYATK